MQPMPCALCLAFESAGRSMAANIAIMAITTRSSIRVKAGFKRSRLDQIVMIESPVSQTQQDVPLQGVSEISVGRTCPPVWQQLVLANEHGVSRKFVGHGY